MCGGMTRRPDAPASLAMPACSQASAIPSQLMPETTGRAPFTSSATMRVTSARCLAERANTSPGVAVGDQTSDAAVAGQPGREPAQLRLVDPEIRREGALHCRQDASVDPFRLAHG